MAGDFELSVPKLLDEPELVRLSTEDLPEVHDDGSGLRVGQTLLIDDIERLRESRLHSDPNQPFQFTELILGW